jgi:hypothetical protein
MAQDSSAMISAPLELIIFDNVHSDGRGTLGWIVMDGSRTRDKKKLLRLGNNLTSGALKGF